jgi:1,2-phenylacetyl-CoA epoxidase PaaB subunit
MSKIRQNVPERTDDLETPAERDLTPWVIFTQLRADGPFVYAGWLDAADVEMALLFAREHYGQDQKCTAIWAAPQALVGGLRINAVAAAEEVPSRHYQIFTQANAGDQHLSSITIEATCAADAITAAVAKIPGAADMHNLWAIPCEAIAATDDSDLIWRHTDQSYRLARGYSREVRTKWEKVREEQALREYEKEELTEMFE